MKALIIYDNLSSAVKASGTLHRAAHRTEENTQWNIRPWRVDVLGFPSASEEALMEAADADLIVFAGPGAYSLPTWLKEWLECWVTRRQVEDAALAVMRGGTEGEFTQAATAKLSRFAARHGLSFIIENGVASEDQGVCVMRSVPARQMPVPPTQEHAFPILIHSSHRCWGINN